MTIFIKALLDGVLIPGAAMPFKFPGGEIHLKFTDFNEPVRWVADIRGGTPDDLFALAMLGDLAAERGDTLSVFLPYLPAARADKGVPTGAFVYAQFLNSVPAGHIIGLDPHSETIVELIGALHVAPFIPLLLQATVNHPEFDGVIAPDIGAKHRAQSVADILGVELFQVRKSRDFDTGAITRIDAPPIPRSGNYLVVDDICDGGGTFRGVASATGVPRENLSLWVTHGIFSGRASELASSYNRIYTTDSHPGHNRVGLPLTVVPTVTHMFQTLSGLINEQ